MYRVVPRSEWGARYADSYRNYTAPLPKRWGYLHHPVIDAPPPNASFEQDAAAIRYVERIGQNRFGWGISYSFPICPSGRIFQGHRRNGVGTHTHGYNSTTFAICFIGNYDEDVPTEEQLNSAAWLMRHGHEKGWTTDMQLDGGHRDLKATACPGANAYRLIPEINRRALNPQEDDMPSAKEIVDELFDRDVFKLPFEYPENQHLRLKWFLEFIGRHAHGAHRSSNANRKAIANLAGQVAALEEAQKQHNAGGSIDYAKVTQAAEAGAKAALETSVLDVDITVNDNAEEHAS